ncbi:hypothetical protein GQX73_g6199 [Xylaria multiplex]|uniref:Uncharacterized protein n=1 Tax=Xylaria multiplex TaxID=323545 RepID=A0A7C8IRP5_9PEZI|nr:hypothetical protein GQX73_g6199 [Xylaria multiplex]
MYNAKILLSMATLAGTSLAQTPTPTDPACAASLSQFSDAPTPAPALASYLATLLGTGPVTAPGHTTALPDFTLEDPVGYQDLICAIAADLPESLIPEFQSYGSGLLSYGSVHISEYDAYVTDCITTGEAASTLTSELHSMLLGTGGLCEASTTATSGSGAYPTGSSNGTYPTGTGSVPTSTGPSTSVPIAGAARPTGAAVGVAAIGGLLGAVALL